MKDKIFSSILNEKYIGLVSGGTGDGVEGGAKKGFLARHSGTLLVVVTAVAAAALVFCGVLAVGSVLQRRSTNKFKADVEWRLSDAATRLHNHDIMANRLAAHGINEPGAKFDPLKIVAGEESQVNPNGSDSDSSSV